MSENYKAKAEEILAGENAAEAVRKLLIQIHDLKRTRSEAEAEARKLGYREGAESVIRQLQALKITVDIRIPQSNSIADPI